LNRPIEPPLRLEGIADQEIDLRRLAQRPSGLPELIPAFRGWAPTT
jgi:hypothetical protein